MADATDPYRQLLGIPAEDQPPNHYRLLGITLFETERGTIDSAAKRLMAQLQRNESGADPATVRRLLGEISNARVCLLTPDKRAAYDELLRAELESADVTDVVVEVIGGSELSGTGAGRGDESLAAGAGQGGGATKPVATAKSAAPAAPGRDAGAFCGLTPSRRPRRRIFR